MFRGKRQDQRRCLHDDIVMPLPLPLEPEREGRPDRATPHTGPDAEAAAGGVAGWVTATVGSRYAAAVLGTICSGGTGPQRVFS